MSNTDPNSHAPDLVARGGATVNGKPSLTTNEAATRLISDYLWAPAGQPVTLTYAFRRDGTPPDSDAKGFQLFNAQQIALVEQALTAWSDVANIRFVRVNDGDGYSNGATILFGNYESGDGAGFAILPGDRSARSADGDVWINAELDYNRAPTIGNYGGLTLLHEIGHAIGLTHPSDYDGDDTGPYSQEAEYYEDFMAYTAMSYFFTPDNGVIRGDGIYPFTPQADDITAVQRLYGVNSATRTENNSYTFKPGDGTPPWLTLRSDRTESVVTLWDAGGQDTIDLSGFFAGKRIDLRAGARSEVYGVGSIVIAPGVDIENATAGNGGSTIIGNRLGNVLRGGNGTDTIHGEGGDDTLFGGDGDDVLDGGSGTNIIDGGGGRDLLLLVGSVLEYQSTRLEDGRWSIAGRGVTNIVTGIEGVRFAPESDWSGRYFDFNEFVLRTGPSVGVTFGPHMAALNDFDGDGRSDLIGITGDSVGIWRTLGTYSTAAYDPGGKPVADPYAGAAPMWFTPEIIPKGTFSVDHLFGGVSIGAQIVATLDMNGDRRADLLLRDVTGRVTVWTGARGTFTRDAFSGDTVGFDWSIVAVGDIDGDAKDDLLWRHENGALYVWRASDAGLAPAGYSGPAARPDQTVAALADFNGDGRADMLLRDADGTVRVWRSTAQGFVADGYASQRVAADWKIAGTADFTGDGRDDILWRHTNGTISVWGGGSDGFAQGLYTRAGPGADYRIAQIGRFNDDAKADILWTTDYGAAMMSYSYNNGFQDSGTSGSAGSRIVAPSAAAAVRAVRNDFDGDGHADILWRHTSGELTTWSVAGDVRGDQVRQTSWRQYAFGGDPVAGTGDFDGDGKADLLKRGYDGGIYIQGAERNVVLSSASRFSSGPVSSGWKIAAIGDMTGDGMDDLLWTNASGALSSWSSNGRGFQQNTYFRNPVGGSWAVAGVADFNGDGRADIMWRDASGAISTWSSTGTSFAENSFSAGGVGREWHIEGLADITGDGRADIVWRNDNGALSTWTSNGAGFDQAVYNASVGTEWKIADLLDFNGDGRADILWRNDNGAVTSWQSNGQGFDQQVINAYAPPEWTIVAPETMF